MQELPHIKKSKGQWGSFLPFQKNKNIDFTGVKQTKFDWLRQYFHQNYSQFKNLPEYQEYLEQETWLREYTLFRALLKKHQGISWRDWEENQFDSMLIEHYQEEIEFFSFVQYLCHKQLKGVKKHALAQGVHIKGDIPILLNPDSSDVWAYRNFFDLEKRAGAPPDLYSPEGQIWGFPLFNWEALKKDQYSWWRRRLQVAQEYYDIYRIDHVVGFFRIWAVSKNEKAKEGHFVPENRHQWPFHGKELLEMMTEASKMLPMAEDLGTIPPEVYSTLKTFGICGTKFMRWERYWDEDGSYISPTDYEPISLSTVSTHDSETLAQYWKKHGVDAEIYAKSKGWKYTPELKEEQREAILYEAHHSSSLFHINLLQEYCAFFPELSWKNLEDERINVPGTESDKNWTFRFKPTIEEITSHEGLKNKISKLIA